MYKKSNDRVSYIKEIQSILRDYRFWTTGIADIGVDGNYDTGTRNAVIDFQRRFNIPPTGIVDLPTWIMLNRVHDIYNQVYGLSQSLNPFSESPGEEIKKGEDSDVVYIIQIIVKALSLAYDGFLDLEVTGIFDEATENAVKYFQSRVGLPETGIVNKPTWNLLGKSYNYLSKENQ